jgi:hypothetical protein
MPSEFVLLLDGVYKHRLARRVEAVDNGAKCRFETLTGERLHMEASKIEELPSGSRKDMQELALGKGVGGTQASFVTKDGRCICVAVTAEYNALLNSEMRLKASNDDEVLHGQVVIGEAGQALKSFTKGNGKTKDYSQSIVLPFGEPKPLLIKIHTTMWVYAGQWALVNDCHVTESEAEAGVPQNHEDYNTLPNGFRTKHYKLSFVSKPRQAAAPLHPATAPSEDRASRKRAREEDPANQRSRDEAGPSSLVAVEEEERAGHSAVLAAPPPQTLHTKIQLIAKEMGLEAHLKEDPPPLVVVLQLAEQMMDINERTGSCKERADAVLMKIG